MAQVLIAGSDESLLEALYYNLVRANHEVRVSTKGDEALAMIRESPPELVILDQLLSGMDALDVCRGVRGDFRNSVVARMPVVVLSTLDGELNRVIALEVGADDYVTKPFSMHELLARIKALLRRSELGTERMASQHLTAGDLNVDLGSHQAKLGDTVLRLKRREFHLLAYLMRNAGQVQTREALLRNVWGHEFAGDARTVDVHVRWLRGKIEPDPVNPLRIRTVRGVGYIFQV